MALQGPLGDFHHLSAMFFMERWILLIGVVAWGISSCNGDREKCAFEPDVSKISINLDWRSYEDSLAAIRSKEDLVHILTKSPLLRDVMLNRAGYPSDSVFINELYKRFTNPHIDTLVMEVRRVFGDLSELKNEFELAFRNFKYYYPEFQVPRIETVITGMEADLYVTDSVIVVGLDHYIGPNAKYQLNHLYEYLRKKYNKDFIVPSAMLLYGIDEKYNQYNPADQTVLAEMVSYGKAYHFAKRMVPCTPDSILIGYTAEEIDGSREYESLIWSRFIEDEVLFSTSREEKKKYILERPKTYEVGDKCPGRIGQWVGWQIVNSYSATHEDQNLKTIMSMGEASKLFEQSGYKPQIVRLNKGKRI
jgi:hypothetical protein